MTFIVCVNCVKIPPGELKHDEQVNTFSMSRERNRKLYVPESDLKEIQILEQPAC